MPTRPVASQAERSADPSTALGGPSSTKPHQAWRKVPCAEVWRLHPRGARRFVPAVHFRPDGTASVYMNYASQYTDAFGLDRILEYRASVNPLVNRDLDRVVGGVVTVYARLPDGYYVADNVRVSKGDGVYLLEM